MPHIHEKIDFVSNVYIVNGNAVLLRLHDKYRAWWPPGGHIELDEDPEHAAIREAKEEVGLDVTLVSASASMPEQAVYRETDGDNLIVPFFMNRHHINENHEHISFEFFGSSDTREVTQRVERERSDNIRWFTREDLDDPQYDISAGIKHYAKSALDALAP
jgi:8-oxo-dGTP pyrophosphatase MutT (NUDIX family)